jgi:hypothetical protein
MNPAAVPELKPRPYFPPQFQQQERFDDFMGVYNNERPHQALGGAYPGYVYTPSVQEYRPPDEPEYPNHYRTIRVTRCGRICICKRKISFSTVFAGQYIWVREIADRIWLVSFMDYDLGFFDQDENRVESVGNNPFALKLYPCPDFRRCVTSYAPYGKRFRMYL